MTRMTRFIAVLAVSLVVLLGVLPAIAQETPGVAPDYLITIIATGLSDSGQAVEIEFSVRNIGGPATQITTAQLIAMNASPPDVVASVPVPALPANGDPNLFTLSVPISNFAPGSRQVFRVQIINASQEIIASRDVPAIEIALEQGPTPEPTATANTGAVTEPQSVDEALPFAITLPDFSALTNLSEEERNQLIGTLSLVLIPVVLLLLVLRLRSQGKPSFGNWQPPYATVPPMDPYSVSGIRQAWQPLAQANFLPIPCTPGADGTTAVIKLLAGADGRPMEGWQVISLRMSQYDMYGRVSRSQVLATRSSIRALNRIARRADRLPPAQIEKRVQRAVRPMVNRFNRRVSSRSAMLPVALDMRLRGKHGEVAIMFELYRCQVGGWTLLDRWQPEMMVRSKLLYETYTFTMYGQVGGESLKEYRRRLTGDVSGMLSAALTPRPTAAPETQQPEAQTPPAELPDEDTYRGIPAVDTGEFVGPRQ